MSKLSEIATTVLEANNGDVSKAVPQFVEMVSKNDALFHELMSPLISTAAYQFITSCVRSKRKAICAQIEESQTAAQGAERLHSMASGFMDFPLPGGKPLRDANSTDCTEASRFYKEQASNMAGKSRFLSDVARRIGTKLVRDALSEIELVRMYKKAMVV